MTMTLTVGEHINFGKLLRHILKQLVLMRLVLMMHKWFVANGDRGIRQDSDQIHKYRVKRVVGGAHHVGNLWADVEFPADNCAPRPDPEFLKIHAAFVKVPYESGVAEYHEKVELDAEENVMLSLHGRRIE